MCWTCPSSSSSSARCAGTEPRRRHLRGLGEGSDEVLHGLGVVDELLGGVEQAARGLDHLPRGRLEVLDALVRPCRLRPQPSAALPSNVTFSLPCFRLASSTGRFRSESGRVMARRYGPDPDEQLVAAAAQLEVVAVGERAARGQASCARLAG